LKNERIGRKTGAVCRANPGFSGKNGVITPRRNGEVYKQLQTSGENCPTSRGRGEKVISSQSKVQERTLVVKAKE